MEGEERGDRGRERELEGVREGERGREGGEVRDVESEREGERGRGREGAGGRGSK